MKQKMIFTDSNGDIVPYDGSEITWRVSAYAVVIENQKVLLVRGKHEKLFDVPGGGIHIGETVEEGLKREVEEEAGVVIAIQQLITWHQGHFYHHGEKKFYQSLLLFFEAKKIKVLEKPTDANSEFVQFISLLKLSDYPLLPYVDKIIKNTSKEL